MGTHGKYLFACLMLISCTLSPSASYEKPFEVELFALPEEHPFEKAKKALLKKDFVKAARLSFSAIQKAKSKAQKAEAEFLLGEVYYQAGDYTKAYSQFQKLVKEYPHFSFALKALERIYEIGAAWLHGRLYQNWLFLWQEDREYGAEILEKLLERYPYLRTPEGELLGDDICMMLGDHYYQSGDYEKAEKYYKKLLQGYKRSEWRERALFRIGETYLERTDAPVYDQDFWHKAKRQFQLYLERYPKGNFVEKAKKHLRYIDETLAAHEYAISRYYYQRGYYISAVISLQTILREYPKTEAAKQAKKDLESSWAKKALQKWNF